MNFEKVAGRCRGTSDRILWLRKIECGNQNEKTNAE
jgi:hypothetical protein